MKTFPTLYKKQKTGKVSEWTIAVETDNDGFPVIVRTAGFTDGKKTVTKKAVKKGSNKGKSNEKTPIQQAEAMAESLWKKQKEDNYFEKMDDIDDVEKVVLYPMLAQPYDENKAKFPCIVQPKLNGVRCTQYRHLKQYGLMSRKGKEFATLDFMKEELDELFGDYSPDGEIYIYQKPLQEIVSFLKREQEGTKNLKYFVYDLAIPDAPFVERLSILKKLFKSYIEKYKTLKYVRLCNSFEAKTKEDIFRLQKECVEMGYEGAIIRSLKAPYHFNERSYDLMKLKNFQDKEFEIVGYEAEKYYDKQTDTYKDIVIWHCMANNGKIFHVRPIGSVLMKQDLYVHAKDYIGKKLTVKYLELSNEGIPVGNPVGSFATPSGEAIRDYE